MTPQLAVESALRAGALGLAVWLLLRLLRVRNPGRERAAWLAVLLAGIALPLVLPLAHRILPYASPAIRLPPARAGTGGYGLVESGGADLLVRLCLGVSAVLLARLGLCTLLLVRLWREATPLPWLARAGVSVRASTRVQVPAAIGAGVLLPAGWSRWSPDVLDRVLAHERSHVERGDFYWQLLARAYRSVFWASPLGWWLERRLALLAEHLSDEAVLALHGDPPGYAEMLLGFSRQHHEPSLSLAMARQSSLSARVERILAPSPRTVPGPVPARRFATAILVLAVASTTVPWLFVGAARDPGALPALTERLEPLDAESGRLEDLPPLRTGARAVRATGR